MTTPRQQQIVDLIRKRGSVSCSELAKALGCTPRTAGQHLWSMGRLGLISPTGIGRFSRWTLPEEQSARDPVAALVRWVFEWRPV